MAMGTWKKMNDAQGAVRKVIQGRTETDIEAYNARLAPDDSCPPNREIDSKGHESDSLRNRFLLCVLCVAGGAARQGL